MVRCGVSKEIDCEFRRNGNCENAQNFCPHDKVISLFEAGKNIDYISSITSYNELEIDTILRISKLIK